MHICHFSQRARDFIFVTMRMESSLFWNHRRIRKLNLKSGEGLLTSKHQPECGIPVTCRAGDPQSVLQWVACDWISGSPRSGIHLQVGEFTWVATPNPQSVRGQFLRLGVSCIVSSHFTPGALFLEILSGILCFCKTTSLRPIL